MKKKGTICLIMIAFTFPAFADVIGDVNADRKVGLEEAVYALRSAAGLQSYANATEPVSFHGFVPEGSDTTADITAIPAGKTFVMTDIIILLDDSTLCKIDLFQDDGSKRTTRFARNFSGAEIEYSMMTGITFSSNSTVVIGGCERVGVEYTISGYYMKN